MLNWQQETQFSVKNVKPSSIFIVTLKRQKLKAKRNKSGNVNSVTMSMKSISMKKRSLKKRPSTTSLKPPLK